MAMNILYDQNMPYAAAYFQGIGELSPFTAGQLNAHDLARCDALLVRSTTLVDAELLKKTPNLRYVATATSGFNHMSLPAIEAANVHWYAASGCNARAVAEYVVATLLVLAERDGFSLSEKTIAIVGIGKVGSTLASFASALGMIIVQYDPPRQQRDKSFVSASFSDVLKADIISLHVPLIRDGAYPSFHMFDQSVLRQLEPQQILINTCRGEVLDNQALVRGFKAHRESMPTVCLDCWENEPFIEQNLIPFIAMGTAHIAGHSLEGKAKGTDMVYQDFCRFYSLPCQHSLVDFLPLLNAKLQPCQARKAVSQEPSVQSILLASVKCMYDIENDDSFFRLHMSKSDTFSDIRSNYPVRREWPAAKIATDNHHAANILKHLGFKLANDSH